MTSAWSTHWSDTSSHLYLRNALDLWIRRENADPQAGFGGIELRSWKELMQASRAEAVIEKTAGRAGHKTGAWWCHHDEFDKR